MMPQLVTVRHRRSDGRPVRLHIPVLLVLLLLSPLLVLAVPVGLVACRTYGVDPVKALYRAGQVLSAMRGTEIEIAQGRSALLLSVR